MAIPKWLVACEEVKLLLWGLYPTSTFIQLAMDGSLHGRRRIKFSLMILLLTKSQSITAPTPNNIHQKIFFLKFTTTSKNTKRYKGYHIIELRIKGISQSKKGLLHCSLMILKRCLSYEISCSINCKMCDK